MLGKERKRKRGIETAAHNCVEIEGSLYVITPCRLKPKEQTQFYLIQAEQWRTATGGSNVKANANPVTLSCV